VIYIYIVGHHRVLRKKITISCKRIVENLVVHVKKLYKKISKKNSYNFFIRLHTTPCKKIVENLVVNVKKIVQKN
jgi:hypothetical protein